MDTGGRGARGDGVPEAGRCSICNHGYYYYYYYHYYYYYYYYYYY